MWPLDKAQKRSQSYFIFARYLGVSQTAFAGWIAGTGPPDDNDLAVITAKLGLGVYGAAGLRLPDSHLERLAAAFSGLPDRQEMWNVKMMVGRVSRRCWACGRS